MPTDASDAEIIVASWDDPASFETIFARHHTVIQRHLAFRAGPDAAHDLAAEVFAIAFAGRFRYKSSYPSARPWLFGIATNLLRDHFRKRRRDSRIDERIKATAEVALPDPTGEIDRRVDAEVALGNLRAAFGRLNEGEREALLLYACWGRSYEEISVLMDVPVGTVRSRLSRARARLRSHAEPLIRPGHR